MLRSSSIGHILGFDLAKRRCAVALDPYDGRRLEDGLALPTCFDFLVPWRSSERAARFLRAAGAPGRPAAGASLPFYTC